MTDTLHFTIPGNPVAKGRPRFRVFKGHVMSYTPAKTHKAEKEVLDAFKYCWPSFKTPFKGPISLKVTFFMQVPTSLSKKKQSALCLSPHVKKPDLDNLIKTVCDALNGYVWEDDSQIYMIQAIKTYSLDAPYTKVEITSSTGE